jgi:hypothetical protein
VHTVAIRSDYHDVIPLNRHGPAVLWRKARRWLEPDLDPRRVTKVFETGEKVVRGGTPVPRALADLDADVDRILEKRRWILERELSEAGHVAPAAR